MVGEAEPLIVTVAKDGRVYLNDNEVTAAELGTKLRAIRRLDAGKPVYLRADRDVRYGSVITAIGEIKGAGIEKLGMMALPLADQ